MAQQAQSGSSQNSANPTYQQQQTSQTHSNPRALNLGAPPALRNTHSAPPPYPNSPMTAVSSNNGIMPNSSHSNSFMHTFSQNSGMLYPQSPSTQQRGPGRGTRQPSYTSTGAVIATGPHYTPQVRTNSMVKSSHGQRGVPHDRSRVPLDQFDSSSQTGQRQSGPGAIAFNSTTSAQLSDHDSAPEDSGLLSNSDSDTGKLDSRAFQQAFYDPSHVKHRRRTTTAQLELLDRQFALAPKPDIPTRQDIAEKLGMTPREVQVWFQNRRAKQKKLDSRTTAVKERSGSTSSSYTSPPVSAHQLRTTTDGLRTQTSYADQNQRALMQYGQRYMSSTDNTIPFQGNYLQQTMPSSSSSSIKGFVHEGYGNTIGGLPLGNHLPPAKPWSATQHFGYGSTSIGNFADSSDSSRCSSAEGAMSQSQPPGVATGPPPLSQLSTPSMWVASPSPASGALSTTSARLNYLTGNNEDLTIRLPYSDQSMRTSEQRASGLPSGNFYSMPRPSMEHSSAPPHQQLFTMGGQNIVSDNNYGQMRNDAYTGYHIPAFTPSINPLLDPPGSSNSVQSPPDVPYSDPVTTAGRSASAYGYNDLSLRRASLAPNFGSQASNNGMMTSNDSLCAHMYGASGAFSEPIYPDLGQPAESTSTSFTLGAHRPSASRQNRSPVHMYAPYPQPMSHANSGAGLSEQSEDQ